MVKDKDHLLSTKDVDFPPRLPRIKLLIGPIPSIVKTLDSFCRSTRGLIIVKLDTGLEINFVQGGEIERVMALFPQLLRNPDDAKLWVCSNDRTDR
jgi:hypothetical protein